MYETLICKKYSLVIDFHARLLKLFIQILQIKDFFSIPHFFTKLVIKCPQSSVKLSDTFI